MRGTPNPRIENAFIAQALAAPSKLLAL